MVCGSLQLEENEKDFEYPIKYCLLVVVGEKGRLSGLKFESVDMCCLEVGTLSVREANSWASMIFF